MAEKTGTRKKKDLTLTQALAQFLAKVLLPDLKTRADQPGVKAALVRQHEAEHKKNLTADGFGEWQTRVLEQVGAAWVLSCVFIRTLEDRGLLEQRRLAGAGAADSEQLFFELAPSLTARDYLLTVYREVASLPGAEDLLGPRNNAAWRLSPSNEAARGLLDFFRQRDAAGELVWRFERENTRFLGDLYQDLSEDVRKRYALLQTPDFVERFILDQTLEPAIGEFGLETVRVIDPTCGSGHFLLGAFDRLVEHRLRTTPGVDVRDHALAALAQVFGVDINPYAVAIARFRLVLAYLRKTGIAKLAQAPKLPLNLVVADSLLYGGKANMLLVEQDQGQIDHAAWRTELFALDDPSSGRAIFRQRYHAVVGNPPYINVADEALRAAYRVNFPVSCHRSFQLVAPFLERFFQLGEDGGFVGAIVGNGFMKREFGKPLIEQILPRVELSMVVDTSGAYIPGHGTPTAILFGRNQNALGERVRAVLGKRGEPSAPEDAAKGLVWRSIMEHLEHPGFENDFISVVDADRKTFRKHPWSLGGGGAAELKATLEARSHKKLEDLIEVIGRSTHTGQDEIFFMPAAAATRAGIPEHGAVALVKGEQVRDWSLSEDEFCLFPYDREGKARPLSLGAENRYYWRFRSVLKDRQDFGQKIEARGLRWMDHSMFFRERFRTPLSITFAEVATHNHFVLDRGDKVFNRTAPVIKLPALSTEEDHLALIAYLNSSTACFWMKQVFYQKGGDQMGDGGRLSATQWEDRYQFAGTGLKAMPIPGTSTFHTFGADMDRLAQKRRALRPAILIQKFGDRLSERLSDAAQQDHWLLQQMVALQERLDWHTYKIFGLLPAEAEDYQGVGIPGQRPFEHLVWDRLEDDDPDREWFTRSRFTPPASPPEPAVQKIIDAIAESPELSLLERMDYKRRWKMPDFAQEVQKAIEDAYTQKAEDETRASSTVRSLRHIVSSLSSHSDCQTWLSLHPKLNTGGSSAAVALLGREKAPFVIAEIFTEAGLTKHKEWQTTWELQRREDLGESVPKIPVPPKFTNKDYRHADYWSLRGPLNVPRERFISYPGCEKDGDPSALIGWAGWDHLQRARALVALYQERKTEDGWPTQRLMPMLVGLHELMFWLELWHSQPEGGSQNPAAEFKAFLDAELHAHKLSIPDLEAWRPEATRSLPKTASAPSGGKVTRARKKAAIENSEDLS